MKCLLIIVQILVLSAATASGNEAWNAYQKGDYKTALKIIKPLADKGEEGPEVMYALMLRHGHGVKQDLKKAHEIWTRWAAKGNEHARTNLGFMYRDGVGVIQDFKISREHFLKASGNMYAQSGLGYLYYEGQGVKQDWKEAYLWMRKAADQGVSVAQQGVGYLAMEGLGVKKNYKDARRWHEKAFAGDEKVYSAHNLGRIYEDGLGVVQDYIEAYKWYSVSAAGDFEEARTAMTRLRALMTKEQVASAQEAAKIVLNQKTGAPASTASVPRAAAAIAAPEKTYSSDIDNPKYRHAEDARNFALVIGIDRYKDLPRAEFAERDAKAVKKHLKALGFPERNIVTLTGADATISGMRKYVEEWLPRNTGADSRLFFYFSGHGAPDPKTGKTYLVPWDGDASFLKSTAYPMDKLYASLESLPTKKIWVALDACFSGAGGRSVLAQGARPLVTKIKKRPSFKSLSVLSASTNEEITGTLPNEGHGIFTYYMLKGIAKTQKKGTLDFSKVHRFLKPRVRDAARRQNRDQTPTLAGPKKVLLLKR